MSSISIEQAKAAKEAVKGIFTAYGEVGSVGIGNGEDGNYCIRVRMTTLNIPEGAKLPTEVMGVQVKVSILAAKVKKQ